MDFPIPIRNAQTGEERNFTDKQGIADFLASREDGADWEGYQMLGELPAATVESVELPAEPEPAAPVEPVAPETPETPAAAPADNG